MIVQRKILSFFSLALYIVALFSSQFFHSHKEENSQGRSFLLHSHYFDHIESNEHSFENEFHLSDNNYFSEDHTYSAVNINIFFVSAIITGYQIKFETDENLSRPLLSNECISLLLQDNYVHSASDTSPPLA